MGREDERASPRIEKAAPSKRPWAVIVRFPNRDASWRRWHVHGTFASGPSAGVGADKLKAEWATHGHFPEVRVVAPGGSRSPYTRGEVTSIARATKGSGE